MAHVVAARPEDMPAWIDLAREVEPLFGPMCDDPAFLRSLHRNIARSTAFCIRAEDGPPGAPILAGMLFSPKPPIHTIGWLAVAQACRRQGLGQRLVIYALALVAAPAEVVVTTFGADHPGGEPARRFYMQLGFHAAEAAPNGPEGGTRQVFRRILR